MIAALLLNTPTIIEQRSGRVRDEATIYAALSDIFADVFTRDDISLSSKTSAKDVADWDSFKQVEIIMAAEQHFGIRFTSADIDGLRDVGDLAAVIARRTER